MDDRPAQTALGTARARFIDGMPRRAAELQAAAEKLSQTPGDEALREDMRRRLHALYATAQVFEADALALAVKTVIARLDAARGEHKPLDAGDLESLRDLAEHLPSYVGGSVVPRPPLTIPSAEPALGAESGSAGAPVELMQSVAGTVSAPPVATVLVVHSASVQARVRELLPAERFEVASTSDPERAITLVHEASPDVALISHELACQPDVDLIRRLQTDPLSNIRGTYVLLPEGATYDAAFVRQTGADGVLVEPLDAVSLAELIQTHATRPSLRPTLRRASRALWEISEGTASEIASTLAEEIRAGIAEALRAGKNETIRVDDPSELMAVAWSAIGKVRAHLSEQSRGRIRFRDDPTLDAPTFLSLSHAPATDQTSEAIDLAVKTALSGARVLVADDDPSVRWFFAGLLREASARVLEAQDGAEALELARRKRPDVVISDILMPKIDGFALCREIKRDAQLAHVPVILLSWKEDFLQRMRERGAGASGYLRKEAGGREILASVADTLMPRVRLREQLAAGGEVRGRVEALGVVPLLEAVARQRPNARITVRDAWNLFEIDVREARSLMVTRTASDGSFARGERAVLQLAGVTSGRFTVIDNQAPLRGASTDSWDKQLRAANERLAALLDAVSDKRLMHIALITFDDEVLASLLDSTPAPLAEVVALFRAGDTTASQLLLEGVFTPGELEDTLRELARRGAIVGVRDEAGIDMVALARRERDEQPGTLRHSSLPPRAARPEKPAEVLRSDARDDDDTDDGTPAEHVASLDVLQAALRADAEPTAAAAPAQPAPSTSLPAAPVDAPRIERRQPLRTLLALALFVALGYAGGRFTERAAIDARPRSDTSSTTIVSASAPTARTRHGASASPVARAPAPTPTSTAAIPASANTPQPASAAASAEPAAATSPAPAAPATDTAFGRVLPFIDRSRGVEVSPEQGLLVVEYAGDAAGAPQLSIGDRDLGRPPVAVALGAGRHELRLRRGADAGFRYLIVRRGETRVITLQATAP